MIGTAETGANQTVGLGSFDEGHVPLTLSPLTDVRDSFEYGGRLINNPNHVNLDGNGEEAFFATHMAGIFDRPRLTFVGPPDEQEGLQQMFGGIARALSRLPSVPFEVIVLVSGAEAFDAAGLVLRDFFTVPLEEEQAGYNCYPTGRLGGSSELGVVPFGQSEYSLLRKTLQDDTTFEPNGDMRLLWTICDLLKKIWAIKVPTERWRLDATNWSNLGRVTIGEGILVRVGIDTKKMAAGVEPYEYVLINRSSETVNVFDRFGHTRERVFPQGSISLQEGDHIIIGNRDGHGVVERPDFVFFSSLEKIPRIRETG